MSILAKQSEVNPTVDFWLKSNAKQTTSPFFQDGSEIGNTPIATSPITVYTENFVAPDDGKLVVVGTVTFNNKIANDTVFTVTLTDGTTPTASTVRNTGASGVDLYRTASAIFTRTFTKGQTATISLTVASSVPSASCFYAFPGLQSMFSPS